ncbi:MAG TPA: hypothetical protein VGD40_24415 [Chryseosolibacter sp.]
MKLPILVFVSIVVFCFACNTKKIDHLTAENDSLRLELQKAKSMVAKIEVLAMQIDSMEGLHQVAFGAVEGKLLHEAMASKIGSINTHVIAMDKNIQSLQRQLRSSRHENTAYVMMMDAVKSELEIRVSEVAVLEGSIADVEQTNEEIIKEKEQAVTQLLSQVNEKQLALAGLEDRLHKLEITFRNAEAEAVYARAVAVEESARKTRLAPARKREALTEALELYKKAKALGKAEAHLNIEALEKFETARSQTRRLQAL